MKSLKPYVKPLSIVGLILLIVVLISWFAFPGWRAQPGGLWLLMGVAAVGIAAIVKNVLDIAKTWKELNPAPPASPASAEPPHPYGAVITNAKSTAGGALAEDQTGKGALIDHVEVTDDLIASSTAPPSKDPKA